MISHSIHVWCRQRRESTQSCSLKNDNVSQGFAEKHTRRNVASMEVYMKQDEVVRCCGNIAANLEEYASKSNKKERKNKKYIELLRAEYTKREKIIEDINTVYSEIRYMVQNHTIHAAQAK